MPVSSISADDERRRQRLRVAAKLMLWLAMAGVVYVFISAIRPGNGDVPSVPSLKVGIADLGPGQARLLTWAGRPVILYRRHASDYARLSMTDARLVDAASARSEQPAAFAADTRSDSPDLFVAIALGTDLGCSVAYLPPADEPFQGQPWAGGFVDSCRKSRFDLAGRVYEAQYATRNLVVPPYSVSGDTLVLGR